MVKYARSKCSDIEFSAEDASRTEVDFLVQAFVVAVKAGATTLNIPDTVGAALPEQFGRFVSDVRNGVRAAVGEDAFAPLIFSAHCHNDLGLAVANSLAAVKAGARQIECTINGLGERAGNAAIEELAMAITLHSSEFGVHHALNTRLLVPTSQMVSRCTGMAVQRNKAVVGENCCLHESGVHVDGLLKHRATYELFSAEQVGWPSGHNGIVLGKHSGRAAYRSRVQALGATFVDEQAFERAFASFQHLTTKMAPGQQATDAQLLETLKPAAVVEQANNHIRIKDSDRSNAQNEYQLVELLGDGISSEVTREGRRILEVVAAIVGCHFHWTEAVIGGRAIDTHGDPLPKATLDSCRAANAILLGAVGTPTYGPECAVRPEQGLLRLRSELAVFANVRPVTVYPSLMARAPFRSEIVENTDIIIVRELTGGIYMNAHTQTEHDATDIMTYTVTEIERIIRVAARLAQQRQKRLVSLDKANVLACSRLWRQVATRIIRNEFPDVKLEHQLIDSASMLLIQRPRDYDVIVTENLFGDIISDEAAALTASLGMMGSASLGAPGTPGLFEPVHGSAPDIAGKGIANPVGTILAVAMMLRYSLNMPNEANAVEQAVRDVIEAGMATPDIAAHNIVPVSTEVLGKAIAERVGSILTASHRVPRHISRRPNGIRAMTLPEKILCEQALGLSKPEVKPGDVLVVKVARTLASEMTWVGMSETWNHVGRPALWRTDRLFLAVDHTVDPTNYKEPFQKSLIDAADSFAKEVQLRDYFGPNTSILHTEFYRQRAQPGTVIIGADSHSCSAGCLGAFAAGLGAADVVMPVVTGQTFIEVPPTLLINFKNDLPFGMTGKDVMLYILKNLKRNTVAFERVVEYSGSIRSLSIDSRFALSNMATEFGAIAGIFPSDEVTESFLAVRRRNAKGTIEELKEDENEERSERRNFKGDADAEYAARYDIDLAQITPLIAKWPSPDNCYPIDHPEIDEIVPEIGRSIRKLDGCFIGACTTTEEELILAGLVLEAGLKAGMKPVKHGQRKVSPGSAIMKARLEQIGILDVYRAAGFTIGAPGCAYCLAVNGVDVAARGSVWLSSQNRNFKNRMGPGSIGNLASASTVAASSFGMEITDPRSLLSTIDRKRFEALLDRAPVPASIEYDEPSPQLLRSDNSDEGSNVAVLSGAAAPVGRSFKPFTGKVQRFGDNVDTDAIIPGQLMLERPLSRLGQFSFHHVRPDFVEKVKQGFDIVVGGVGFGSGSSREEAVSCLRACGVKCVIAKSFAFIFGRNLLCLDLIGLVVSDARFYELACEGVEVTVDLDGCYVAVCGERFTFRLSDIQKQIYREGGVIEMYRHQGKHVFHKLAAYAKSLQSGNGCGGGGGCTPDNADLDLPVTTSGSVQRLDF